MQSWCVGISHILIFIFRFLGAAGVMQRQYSQHRVAFTVPLFPVHLLCYTIAAGCSTRTVASTEPAQKLVAD